MLLPLLLTRATATAAAWRITSLLYTRDNLWASLSSTVVLTHAAWCKSGDGGDVRPLKISSLPLLPYSKFLILGWTETAAWAALFCASVQRLEDRFHAKTHTTTKARSMYIKKSYWGYVYLSCWCKQTHFTASCYKLIDCCKLNHWNMSDLLRFYL